MYRLPKWLRVTALGFGGLLAAYALSFSIPMAIPGLKVLCRDSFAAPPDSFDHPLSGRFDERGVGQLAVVCTVTIRHPECPVAGRRSAGVACGSVVRVTRTGAGQTEDPHLRAFRVGILFPCRT